MADINDRIIDGMINFCFSYRKDVKFIILSNISHIIEQPKNFDWTYIENAQKVHYRYNKTKT